MIETSKATSSCLKTEWKFDPWENVKDDHTAVFKVIHGWITKVKLQHSFMRRVPTLYHEIQIINSGFSQLGEQNWTLPSSALQLMRSFNWHFKVGKQIAPLAPLRWAYSDDELYTFPRLIHRGPNLVTKDKWVVSESTAFPPILPIPEIVFVWCFVFYPTKVLEPKSLPDGLVAGKPKPRHWDENPNTTINQYPLSSPKVKQQRNTLVSD